VIGQYAINDIKKDIPISWDMISTVRNI